MRLIVGIAFIVHGYPKIQNPTGWMGAHAIAPPPVMAAAAFAEFVGGVVLVLGICTSIAAFFIAVDMFVALFLAELPRGAAFSGPGHTYEPALLYLVVSAALVFAGPGRFSLDARLVRERAGP
ncbi:MAG: DoxX family protein [Candidatus Velthaea sp.]